MFAFSGLAKTTKTPAKQRLFRQTDKADTIVGCRRTR